MCNYGIGVLYVQRQKVFTSKRQMFSCFFRVHVVVCASVCVCVCMYIAYDGRDCIC